MNYSIIKNSFLLAVFGSAANVQGAHALKPEKQPNIVYILCDDLGIGDVSSYNPSSKISTPNIDKLAKTGVRFTDVHTGSSVSTPTRYGILTGRYAWRTRLKQGVLSGYDKALIESGRETVASMLQKRNYNTACIGKWHLGWNWSNIEAGEKDVDFSKAVTGGPNDVGFDYSYNIVGSLDMPPYVYVENALPIGIPKDTCASGKGLGFFRSGIAAPGFKQEEVLPNFTSKALGYIKEKSKDAKPFFLYFPLTAPHTPILPTKEFQGKSGLTPYGDFVLMCDDVLKKVVAQLKESGVYDNTIIIFTSDNGCSKAADIPSMTAKGHYPSGIYRGAKSDIWDGGHRVPFIVSWPKSVKPKATNKLVCTTDLFRTIAELEKVKLADNMAEDSYSFLTELTGKSTLEPQRETVIHHSIDGMFAIRKGDWKQIFCSYSGGWSQPNAKSLETKTLPPIQLYNMRTDSEEKNNQYDKHPEIVTELTAMITKQVKEGRSTLGVVQQNTGPKYWKQLNWIIEGIYKQIDSAHQK
jgi:arylsulfatase A-like enzyme